MNSRAIVGMLLLAIITGCGGPSRQVVPTAPTVGPEIPSVPPPLPEQNSAGAATLEVVSFAIREWRMYYWQYDTELQLKEVSAKSGVTLTNMVVSYPGGTSDSDCTSSAAVHLNAGSTWNISSLSYCAPYAYGDVKASYVTFRATTTDDFGTTGTLVITREVPK